MSLGTTEEYDYDTPSSGNLQSYGKVTEIAGDFTKKETYGTGANRGYKVGVVEGEKNVGGLVGNLSGTTRFENQKNYQSDVYNSGNVIGMENVGGLVGTMSGDAEMARVYNTNESSNANGKKAGETRGYANNAVSILTDEGQVKDESVYGRVTGVDKVAAITKDDGTTETVTQESSGVGGLVGSMSGGTIENAYNAGDVKGTNDVGGLVGTMTGGTVKKAYNADNNTILMTKQGANGSHLTAENRKDEGEYVGFTVTQGVDAAEQASAKGLDKNDLNGVYTYDVLTATWTRSKVTKNADGSETTTVLADHIATDDLPAGNLRHNNNRMAYRDARVTGKPNVGGLIGTMTAGTVNQDYSEGKVTGGSDADGKPDLTMTGGIVGTFAGGTLGQDAQNKVFFATKNEATGEYLSEGGLAAVGTSSGSSSAYAEGLTMQQLTQSENIGWSDGSTAMSKDHAQNGDWIAYNNQTAPLLKTFMTSIDIKRQYQYDGTVHNLVTSDVSNYYGGAFFASDKDEGYGKNVYTKGVNIVEKDHVGDYQVATGSENANTDHSSVYQYDKSDLWSPQHGYYTDADASVIITPEPVKIQIENVTKTYGQLTKGYVYRYDETDETGNVTKSTYYSYNKDAGTWTASETAPTQGTTYIITLTHTENDKARHCERPRE